MFWAKKMRIVWMSQYLWTWLYPLQHILSISESGYLIFRLSYQRYQSSLYLNRSLWELRSGTRLSCKLCWCSMEHICWLNGFKSSRVQGIRWDSNYYAAARYAVDTTIIISIVFPLNSTRNLVSNKTWLLSFTYHCSVQNIMVLGNGGTINTAVI